MIRWHGIHNQGRGYSERYKRHAERVRTGDVDSS